MTSAKPSAKATSSSKGSASLIEESIEYQIGIRELRQDASRVIALVESGASITITRHGKPVAVINPPIKGKLDILVERGAITPATKKLDLRTWKRESAPAPQEVLDVIRRDREDARF